MDDDPCKTEREALAQAAQEYGMGPMPGVQAEGDGSDAQPEGAAEMSEGDLETMRQREKKFADAQAAFDDCIKKNEVQEDAA